MSEIQGGCRCGAVRYTLALGALPRTYACHCRDCQTWSGSAFSQQTFLPEVALRVSGPLVIYQLTAPSGRISTQRMCGVCHTRVYNTNSARPGFVIDQRHSAADLEPLAGPLRRLGVRAAGCRTRPVPAKVSNRPACGYGDESGMVCT